MGISVIQPGARLHYAVPAIFAAAGLLDALYTDLHAEHGILRAIDTLLPASLKPKPLRRLLGRRLPDGLPQHLVRDRSAETLLRSLIGLAGIGQNTANRVAAGLLKDLERAPIGIGDTVYTVLINEDLESMRRLKERGAKIVHECIIGPDVGRIVAEERATFPGLDLGSDNVVNEADIQRDAMKYAVADVVLAPSRFTALSVAALAPRGCQIEIVPYGLKIENFGVSDQPEVGRVLCVGSVGVRKGHPYLGLATQHLLKTGTRVNVRVVGPNRGINLAHPTMVGPTYVGQVPRTSIYEEFRRADVFVLPTICDSFGLVLVEAMAAGIPVISTPNCGDVVRDGVDGFVVPPRDPLMLAERIKEIVADRKLRERMSRNARERAQNFSLDAYGKRLLGAMDKLKRSNSNLSESMRD